MSMTMQDYIVRFGIEGLNNLDIAVLGMSKLDTAVAKSSASLSSTLSIAARDAGISFSNLGEVIGTKTVRSFAQFEQGGTRVIGNIKQMQAAILQADGAIVKLNYNMQRTGNGM